MLVTCASKDFMRDISVLQNAVYFHNAVAVCVDEDNVDGILSAVKDFEAVNFDYGDNLFTFCRKFEYDWKRDLPDIARLIDMKYPEGCEIILT